MPAERTFSVRACATIPFLGNFQVFYVEYLFEIVREAYTDGSKDFPVFFFDRRAKTTRDAARPQCWRTLPDGDDDRQSRCGKPLTSGRVLGFREAAGSTPGPSITCSFSPEITFLPESITAYIDPLTIHADTNTHLSSCTSARASITLSLPGVFRMKISPTAMSLSCGYIYVEAEKRGKRQKKAVISLFADDAEHPCRKSQTCLPLNHCGGRECAFSDTDVKSSLRKAEGCILPFLYRVCRRFPM